MLIFLSSAILALAIFLWQFNKELKSVDERVSFLEHKTRRNLAQEHFLKGKDKK